MNLGASGTREEGVPARALDRGRGVLGMNVGFHGNLLGIQGASVWGRFAWTVSRAFRTSLIIYAASGVTDKRAWSCRPEAVVVRPKDHPYDAALRHKSRSLVQERTRR